MALEFGVTILWPTLEPITLGWLQSLRLPRHSTPPHLLCHSFRLWAFPRPTWDVPPLQGHAQVSLEPRQLQCFHV